MTSSTNAANGISNAVNGAAPPSNAQTIAEDLWKKALEKYSLDRSKLDELYKRVTHPNANAHSVAKDITTFGREDVNALVTDEVLKELLERSSGGPVSPEKLASARALWNALSAKEDKSLSKNIEKNVVKAQKKAEKKGESLDHKIAVSDAYLKTKEQSTTLEKITSRISRFNGSCSKCDAYGLDLAKQNITLQKCARCLQAMYCSKECQRAHWPTHKPVCKLQASKA